MESKTIKAVQMEPITITLAILLTGCATSSFVYDPKNVKAALEKNIKGEYEQVFKAAQISLADYPIEVSDMESGYLQTAYIRNEQLWQPPHLEGGQKGGYRYQLHIQILRVRRKGMTKVIITKNKQYKKDFFSTYKPVKTDGLEEIALLYRIQRELWFQQEVIQ